MYEKENSFMAHNLSKKVLQRSPLSELKLKSDNASEDGMNFTNSNDVILLKTEFLVVEAKVMNGNIKQSEEESDLLHTFNQDETYLRIKDANQQNSTEDEMNTELNETSKNYIFDMLKTFLDNFYQKIKERQVALEKEEFQNNKIAEYENELRILKDWNSFILINMNKENIMDNYEN